MGHRIIECLGKDVRSEEQRKDMNQDDLAWNLYSIIMNTSILAERRKHGIYLLLALLSSKTLF